jgi:hypothetical protein
MKKKRTKFFDKKNVEIVGIELPLYQPVNGVCFVAYIDLLLYDKVNKKYIVADFKTSKAGWKDYDKKDEVKTSQLILYKMFLAKSLNISVENIDIEYVILKRKVAEDLAYPIPRISKFVPASGKIIRSRVEKMFNEFISECFTDGKYNKDKEYEALTGKNGFNCRFCEFANDEEKCPKSKRI